MHVAQVFAHAVLQRVALVLVVGGLAWFGIGTARAASGGEVCSPGGAGHPCTQQTAYEYCMAWATEKVASTGGVHTGPVCTARTSTTWRAGHTTSGYVQDYTGTRDTFAFVPCPSGTTWDDPSKTCFDPQRCLAMPARSSGWYTGSALMCHDGCQFGNPTDRQTFTAGGVTYKSLGGSKPTGQACAASEDTKPLPDVPQYCQQMGTQTVCLKSATGEQCYSASTGRQICWKPGETGEKPDMDTLQKRNAGPTEQPPTNVNLPSGDQLQKTGDSATTTSTRTVNNSTTTTVTTTTNYTTVNGTNAGTGNKGESGTGDGSGKEDDGEGEGSASGGETCDAPPQCSGDPVNCAVLRQTYLDRCEASKARKDLATEAAGLDQSKGTENVDTNSIFGSQGSGGVGEGDFNMAGYGFGNSCPAPPEFYGTSLDYVDFCNVLTVIGMLIAAIGILHGFYILMEK